MQLTVQSDDKKIEVYHNSKTFNDRAYIAIPDKYGKVAVSIDKADIPTLINTLQKFSDRMTEVLGEDVMK